MMKINTNNASFRDPNGFIFTYNGEIYRAVMDSYRLDYEQLINSGLYQLLVDKGYLVAHQETTVVKPNNCCPYKILQPQRIPFITYPYEWSFSQLKDAALLTLKIQLIALKHGMCLKDASTYNVQFVDGKPIFIDTLSFTNYEAGCPWIAHRQFCQHFLAPLMLMRYTDLRLSQLLKNYIDGIPLDLANNLLSWRAKLRPSVFFNICLQSRFQQRYANSPIKFHAQRKVPLKRLILLNQQLQDTINDLRLPKATTEWGNYYSFTNYDQVAFTHKQEIISRFIQQISPKTLWDLGANNGLFTRLASKQGISAIAFDVDPLACEKNYQQIKQTHEKNLLPVLFDLTNPSPAIGWANAERFDLLQRDKPDVVMALALIHHLAISNNIPLVKIADYFRTISRYLIIEFVPKDDSQVQKLLATREDIFADYDVAGFERSFADAYQTLHKEPIRNSMRILYLLERK